MIAIVNVLMRPQFDISLNVYKDVHRVIGTFIGAIIAIGIISIIDNQWLLTLLTLLFAAATGFFAKTGNYAFLVILFTPLVLIALDIMSPSTGLVNSYDRFLNTAIGCSLPLIVIIIFWIVSKTKSNQALRKNI